MGVICYLKQLLDTGFFHADPHPGNLIRTPDGRLAILDFGLVTIVDDNIKVGPWLAAWLLLACSSWPAAAGLQQQGDHCWLLGCLLPGAACSSRATTAVCPCMDRPPCLNPRPPFLTPPHPPPPSPSAVRHD